MYRVFLTLVLSVLLASAIGDGAEGLQTRARQIRAAMEGRDFQRAEQLVRDIQRTERNAFSANNYDYLLARLVERRGANPEAAALYQSILARGSILSQYALWRLALISRSAGDFSSEKQYLDRLIASFPSSTLAAKARERKIESLFEAGEYAAVIPTLRGRASASGTQGRNSMAQLGEAYMRVGDSASARALFDQLISASRDDYALKAAQGLDALDAAAGRASSQFEALRRARIYLHNRHWAEARAHLLKIAASDGGPNRAEAIYQTGFTYYREDNYSEAVKWFQRAYEEYPRAKEGEQGYYWVATALQKARKYKEAARRYADFLAAYPNSELTEGAYRNVVDSLRYAGSYSEAIDWSRRITRTFSNRPLVTVGLFNEARIELSSGNHQAALQALTRLEAHRSSPRLFGAPARGEASFLKIYTLEVMGRISEAVTHYLSISDDRDNYFGLRATERLRALAQTPQGRRVIEPLERRYRNQAREALEAGRYQEAKDAANQALRLTTEQRDRRELLGILRATYSRLPAYAGVSRYRLIPAARGLLPSDSSNTDRSSRSLASELLFLGLYDEGAAELRVAGLSPRAAGDGSITGQYAERPVTASSTRSSGDLAYSMAVYSNRGDQAHYAIAFAEPVFRAVPADYRLELLPRDLAELMYPAPYKETLTDLATASGVDPRLILSLARQESRFNPTVKSHAAARGLLQFIPETAQTLALEEGLQDFKLDDVYEPEIAIRLAVRYVSNLLRLFPENPYAASASYNTGESNVERWIFRAKSDDVDRLVAEIAIPETKDYVAKVISNYRAYNLLYARDLRPVR